QRTARDLETYSHIAFLNGRKPNESPWCVISLAACRQCFAVSRDQSSKGRLSMSGSPGRRGRIGIAGSVLSNEYSGARRATLGLRRDFSKWVSSVEEARCLTSPRMYAETLVPEPTLPSR